MTLSDWQGGVMWSASAITAADWPAGGPWLILVYSVTPKLAAQRDLESHITIAIPNASSAK